MKYKLGFNNDTNGKFSVRASRVGACASQPVVRVYDEQLRFFRLLLASQLSPYTTARIIDAVIDLNRSKRVSECWEEVFLTESQLEVLQLKEIGSELNHNETPTPLESEFESPLGI